MILDSLRYWVQEMHVDGFRFDLASILSRDPSRPCAIPNPPVIWDIESDPVLAGTKLIAEAWDAAGLYQVGSFIGDSWKEWNGRFRDDVRAFFRGDPGAVRRVADRLVGSPEIYGHEEREPEQSINFVTCHDGFTLNDLVSYDGKHNEANGEDNRDGANDNRSWNCGFEGPTNDPGDREAAEPAGQELPCCHHAVAWDPDVCDGRRGTAYAASATTTRIARITQISWLDWHLVEKHADVHRFVSLLNARRLLRDLEHEHQRISLNQLIRQANKTWHGVRVESA